MEKYPRTWSAEICPVQGEGEEGEEGEVEGHPPSLIVKSPVTFTNCTVAFKPQQNQSQQNQFQFNFLNMLKLFPFYHI